jgi:hypothetical protein
MRYLTLLLLYAGTLFAQPVTGPVAIDAEAWAAPRSGPALVAMPPLGRVVRQLLDTPGSRLLIRYSGGESGQLWVQELRAWLVALGIPSARIEILPGATRDDRLLLEIES